MTTNPSAKRRSPCKSLNEIPIINNEDPQTAKKIKKNTLLRTESPDIQKKKRSPSNKKKVQSSTKVLITKKDEIEEKKSNGSRDKNTIKGNLKTEKKQKLEPKIQSL